MDPTEDWQALLAEDPAADDVDELVEDLEIYDDDILGASLSALTDAAFRGLLVSGDDAALRGRFVAPLADAVARSTPVTPPDEYVDGLGLVRCSTLLAASVEDVKPRPAAVLEKFLAAAMHAEEGLPERERTSYALACAAHGFDDALHALIGEPPMVFAPGASFGPDVRSFARYVTAAVAASASIDDFKTAWTSFVAYVPARLETRGVRWSDLLLGGYGAYVRVAGAPPAVVLDLVREFVRSMAKT